MAKSWHDEGQIYPRTLVTPVRAGLTLIHACNFLPFLEGPQRRGGAVEHETQLAVDGNELPAFIHPAPGVLRGEGMQADRNLQRFAGMEDALQRCLLLLR